MFGFSAAFNWPQRIEQANNSKHVYFIKIQSRRAGCKPAKAVINQANSRNLWERLQHILELFSRLSMSGFIDEVDLLSRIIRLVNQCRTTVLATPLDVSPSVDPNGTMQIGSTSCDRKCWMCPLG